MQTPQPEVEITTGLVAALLSEQRPDLANLPLEIVAQGWDNVMVRIGNDLAARLPRREIAADLLLTEQLWLPKLPSELPIPVPLPLFSGLPGGLFAWPWSVVPWSVGSRATEAYLGPVEAERLGVFLAGLHRETPEGLPWNPFRSVPLRERGDERRLAALPARARSLWEHAANEAVDVPLAWIHGDLHPKNVIVDQWEMTMIVDWGDTCLGDPASDLSAFWMLCPDEEASFRRGYGPISDSTWLRGKGTAVVFAALFIALEDDPEFVAVGRATLDGLGVA